MAGRTTRSYSQLSTWLHCAHSYKLTKILRLAEAPSVWLPAGSAVHEATERFDVAVWQAGHALAPLDPEMDLSEFDAQFDEAFEAQLDEYRQKDPDESKWRTAGRKTKDKPNGESIDWWRSAGRAMFQSYIVWRHATDEQLTLAETEGQPAIELEVVAPVGESRIPMRGFVDRVFIDTTSGEPLVVDLKTGSRMPYSPVQLALYSVQLEGLFDRPVVWGAYWNARKGTLDTPIDLSRWNDEMIGEVFEQFDKAVTNGIFPPNIDTHCVSCGVRAHCKFVGGLEPRVEVAA